MSSQHPLLPNIQSPLVGDSADLIARALLLSQEKGWPKTLI
jgi:hypothetical protein